MNYTYYTKGTCSKQIDLEINGDVITNGDQLAHAVREAYEAEKAANAQ